MSGLTPTEIEVFEYVREYVRQNGYPPSVRDICAALGIRSTSTVHSYLARLDERGYLTKQHGKSRAITVEDGFGERTERMVRVPLLGRVTAGTPITAVQSFDGYIDFPREMARGKANLFALRVIGESMNGAGIMDGDIVVAESRQNADGGEIVVAMIEDEATIKRFFREKNGLVRLQPENPIYEPIIADNVTILGKVIANFRFY